MTTANWVCNDCSRIFGKNDMWFDGLCGECFDAQKVSAKQKEVTTLLMKKFGFGEHVATAITIEHVDTIEENLALSSDLLADEVYEQYQQSKN